MRHHNVPGPGMSGPGCCEPQTTLDSLRVRLSRLVLPRRIFGWPTKIAPSKTMRRDFAGPSAERAAKVVLSLAIVVPIALRRRSERVPARLWLDRSRLCKADRLRSCDSNVAAPAPGAPAQRKNLDQVHPPDETQPQSRH